MWSKQSFGRSKLVNIKQVYMSQLYVHISKPKRLKVYLILVYYLKFMLNYLFFNKYNSMHYSKVNYLVVIWYYSYKRCYH